MVKIRIKKIFQSMNALTLGVGILFITIIAIFSWQSLDVSAGPKQMQDMPTYNWTVSEDLGVGDIPGMDPAQRFVVSHPTGWRVLAYCLEPGEEPPPEGSICELVDEDTFWCGDPYQNIRQYQVLQAPPPTPTSTATSTTTATPTSTATATSIPPTKAATKKPSPTPTPRPKMGGDGNVQQSETVQFGLGLSLVSFGILIALIDWRRLFRRN